MGFAIKEYVYLKNRILPNLAKNLKQTLRCTSTVVVQSDVDFSRTEPGTKPLIGVFLKVKKENVQNRANRCKRKQVWCRKLIN